MWLLGILAVQAVMFGRSVSHEYVWDDRDTILNSAFLGKDLMGGLRATQHDHLDPQLRQQRGGRMAHDSYRPLLFLSFAADVALFGKSPAAMHSHNLALAMLAAALAFALLRRTGLPDAFALAGTALFALHPFQAETTVYASTRGDLLAGVLVLGAANLALRSADGPRSRTAVLSTLSALLFLLSLFAKEASVALPAAVFAFAWANGDLRRHLPGLAGLGAVPPAYLLLRASLVSAASNTPTHHVITGGLWRLGATGFDYLRTVLLPFNLSTERLYPPGMEALGWVAAVAVMLALPAAALVLRSSQPDGARALRWVWAGLLWFWALLGPSVMVVAVQNVVADRYMFLPLLGVVVALAHAAVMLWERMPRLRVPLRAAAALWAAPLLFVTWSLVPVWRDNETLYAHAVAAEPSSAMAHFRLGHAYTQQDRWSEALPRFEHAVNLSPKDSRFLNNLAVAQMRVGELPAAEVTLSRSIAASGGTHFRAHYNLALVQFQLGKDRRACTSLASALAQNPAYTQAADLHRARCTPVPAGAVPAP